MTPETGLPLVRCNVYVIYLFIIIVFCLLRQLSFLSSVRVCVYVFVCCFLLCSCLFHNWPLDKHVDK
jgi:hypothetical protein